MSNFEDLKEHYRRQTALNIVRLLDTYRRWGEKPLPRDLAQRILSLPEQEKIDSWLAALPGKANDPEEGELLRQELERCLEPAPKHAPETTSIRETGMDAVKPVQSMTFAFTATRAFEEAWWKVINILANGAYVNKNTADCVEDPATLARLTHHHRDLEPLAEYLLGRYRQAIASAGMEGKIICGEMRFHWKTDFDFAAFGGWMKNQQDQTCERNLIVVIPGRNHGEAVMMADHYDTAYREDVYEKSQGGTGARIASAGADDNHSATATLLQAAPIFLQLSQQGLLERDIWLVHLTGEEFPSDCLGARELARALVEDSLCLYLGNGQTADLSNTRLVGAYIMDMIGHNRDYGADVIQIAPGRGRGALQLAWHAHDANTLWNAGTVEWNSDPSRLGMGRGRCSEDGIQIPQIAEHLQVHDEIRLIEDPRSSLFNTDGQIFSDCGIPVVLIMENYDISRSGYHDTMDTMKNIDLDYGAALASVAIETVAIAAHCKTPPLLPD
ncbi:MAG: M28 family peptidase [Chloroflexi bacterium]|nr:M28 family peptidase [Chloroflexota bacterium]